MMRPRAQLGAVLLAVLIAGCDLFFESPMLEVGVTNESDSDVSVTISQEAWTILVDEVPVTDSSRWPPDNPTVDFSIHIGPDGSVEIIDD